jgi:hypothetical protein
MEGQLSRNVVATADYSARRLTVPTGSTQADFQSRYEQAVPPLPEDEVMALVEQEAPWEEMLDLVHRAAPWDFLLYWTGEGLGPLVHLAGNKASACSYLMGNHTIMERMFRYEPAVLLYAPLHTVIWSDPGEEALFTFDKPSDQFGSFGNPQVTAVGRELDEKLAALLEHLNVPVPAELR